VVPLSPALRTRLGKGFPALRDALLVRLIVSRLAWSA